MNKIVYIGTAVLGVILAIAGAIVLWGVVPGQIKNQVADQMYIRNGTGDAYERFQRLPLPLKWKVYFFNITNADEWNGKDVKSLNFTEVGPYVWVEYRWKEEIHFLSGDNVTFVEKKNYTFSAAESKQDGRQLNSNDLMNIVHPALALGTSFLSILPFSSIALSDTVENIAFHGMDSVQQSLFTCDDCQTAIREIHTGKSHPKSLNQLILYNDLRRMPTWNDSGTCNEIRGTDGTQFHPDLSADDILYAFEPMLCRSLKFKSGLVNQQIRDIATLRFYTVDDNFAKTKENQCFCLFDDPSECLKGTLNLRKCPPATLSQANIIASQPYFMNNRDLYHESGLTAPLEMTEENYGTTLDIEPYTGLVLQARKRLQLSVLLTNGTNKFLNNLEKKHLYVPLVWIEESGDVDEANANKLQELIFSKKRLVTGLLIGGMALGVLFIAIAGACAYFGNR